MKWWPGRDPRSCDRLESANSRLARVAGWQISNRRVTHLPLCDERLNAEIVYTSREAHVLMESWAVHYNAIPPHRALEKRPSAPEFFAPGEKLPITHEAA